MLIQRTKRYSEKYAESNKVAGLNFPTLEIFKVVLFGTMGTLKEKTQKPSGLIDINQRIEFNFLLLNVLHAGQIGNVIVLNIKSIDGKKYV